MVFIWSKLKCIKFNLISYCQSLFTLKLIPTITFGIILLICLSFLGCSGYYLLDYSARTLYPDCGVFPADTGSENILTTGISVVNTLDNSNFKFADGSYLEYSTYQQYGDDSLDGNRLNTFLHFDPICLNTFVGYDFYNCISSLSELKLGVINSQLYFDWSIGFGMRLIGNYIGSHILSSIGIANIRNELKIAVWDPTEFGALLPSNSGYNYLETNNSSINPSFGLTITINTLGKTFIRPFINAGSKFYYSNPNNFYYSYFLSNAVSIGVLKNIKQTTYLLGLKISRMSFYSQTAMVNPTYLRPSLVFQVTRTFR